MAKGPLTLCAKPERHETQNPHTWSVGGLFYVASCSCSDPFRSPTARAESQISSETNAFSHPA